MMNYTKNATVCSMNDLASIESGVTHITVSDNCGNENTASELYFARFSQLKELVIGDNCFMNVDQLNLIGLPKLRSVVIGENSFTKWKHSCFCDPNRRFYLKDCPKCKSIVIDCYSFSDYSVCVIENMDALEGITLGSSMYDCYNFYGASLELRSVIAESE